MGILSAPDRRQSTPGDRDEIHIELRTLSLTGFARLAGVSSVCLTFGTFLAASTFHDRWLWRMSPIILAVSLIRVVLIHFLAHPSTETAARRIEPLYAITTFLFCCSVAALTVYSFHQHDPGLRTVCIIGTFTISAGISSRVSFLPFLSECCVGMMLGALGVSLLLSPNALLHFSVVLVLVAAVTHCAFIISTQRLIIHQIRTRRNLRDLAHRDWLTGLANRHRFETRLEEICAAGSPFTLWMIDLDGFKSVNDTYGHAAGDELLKQVAQRLEKVVRSCDLVARQGGDEFVILQPNVFSEAAARKLAVRLGEAISAPFYLEGHRARVAASGGIKIIEKAGSVPGRVLQAADRALYTMKESGQSGFAFA